VAPCRSRGAAKLSWSGSSRAGTRRRGSPGAAWLSPPLRWFARVGTVLGAPPVGRGGDGVAAARVGVALQEPGQVGFQAAQAVQLGPDLGQPLAQQRLGVAAGTLAPVGDLEQLADLPQPQAGPLG
jgi:hypothetical protein